MQPAKGSSPDRATEVGAEVRPAAPWRVVSLDVLDNSRLRVGFVDGTLGEVRMQGFLASPTVEGTVFEPLRDPAVFAKARIELGTVQWPNGADLAPDAMYDAIRTYGVWSVK